MKIVFYCFIFLIYSTHSFANIGAVSTATGGTGRGTIEPVDGVLLNPSIIADLPKNNFSVNYSSTQWAMTVSDNGSDALFPAAMKFMRSNENSLETQQLGIVMAAPRWKKLSFGLTASVVEYSQTLSAFAQQNYRQSTLDFGATLAIDKNFGFGFVATRIVSSEVGLQEDLQLPKTLSLGLSYTYLNFIRTRFDVQSGPQNRLNQFVYMAGLESYVNDWVVFRLGYKNDNVAKKDYGSLGMGFAGPQFGLHYAFISNVKDKSEDQHLIDLGIPF